MKYLILIAVIITSNLQLIICQDGCQFDSDCLHDGECDLEDATDGYGKCLCIPQRTGAHCEKERVQEQGKIIKPDSIKQEINEKSDTRKKSSLVEKAGKRSLLSDTASNVGGINPKLAAEKRQPVLIYNPSLKEFMFVSSDVIWFGQHDNYLETHDDRDDDRNVFEIQTIAGSNDKFNLYNKDKGMYAYVSDRKNGFFVRDNHVLGNANKLDNGRFDFEFEESDIDGLYKMKNVATGKYVFASSDKAGIPRDNIIEAGKTRGRGERALFQLSLEKPYREIKFQFDVESGKLEDLQPILVATKTIENPTGASTSQSSTFTHSCTVTESSTFTHTAGVTLKVDTTFKTGVPVIAEGKISASLSASYTFSYGKTSSVSKSFTASFTVTGEPGKKTKGEVIVKRSRVQVPYTMTIVTAEGKEFESKGIWSGMSHWDMLMKISYEPI